MSAKALSYADYIFGPTDVLTQRRYGAAVIRQGTSGKAAIEARNRSEIASKRPRSARSALNEPGGREGRTKGVKRHDESPPWRGAFSTVAGHEETKALRKAGSVENDVATRCGMRVPHD